MPLGEAPITSYFPRRVQGKGKQPSRGKTNQKAKKPNGSTEISPSTITRDSEPANKRTREVASGSLSSLSSLTSLSSESPPPTWDIFSTRKRKSKKRRNVGVNKTCSIISLEDDSDDNRHAKVRVGPSLDKGKQLLKLKNKVAKADVPRHDSPNVADRVAVPCSGVPKATSNYNKSGQLNQTPPSDDGEIEIQSSQTFERQGENFYASYQLARKGAATTSPVLQRHSDRGVCSVTDNPRPISTSDDAWENAKDPPVDSSQTQNILLNYVSPHRTRIRRQPFVIDTHPLPSRNEDMIEGVVRSSQSQYEIALSQTDDHRLQRIPQGWGKVSSYRDQRSAGSQPPTRTYSDGLFSVPRRGASPTEDYAQHTCQPTHDIDIPRNAGTSTDQKPVQEDSETEPETDNETSNSHGVKHSRRQKQSAKTSLCGSSQTQSGVSTASDDGFTQLPDVVQEFQAMFGSDESYPPDFPSSLRW